MKKNKFINLVGLALLAALTGACEKIIKPKDVPQQDPRLVLNCIVYPDSVVRANVSLSKSILNNREHTNATDAVCELYIDDVFSEHLKYESNGYHKGTIMTTPGKKYTIKAQLTNFKDVEGSSTLPQPTEITKVERYDTTTSRVTFGSSILGKALVCNLKMRVYIKDDLNAENYYSITGYAKLFDSLGTELPEKIELNISHSNGDSFTEVHGNGISAEIDDKSLVNGRDVLMNLDLSFTYPVRAYRPRWGEIAFVISSMSEDYYKYKTSLDKQRSVNSDPFSEPVLVFSNITNGVGIVGCTNFRTYPNVIRFVVDKAQ